MEIRPLTPERLADFQTFFDGPAFADNPDWSGCHCMFFHFAGTNDEWQNVTLEANRAAKAALIANGEAHGYFAYENEIPVGWVHAAPRTALPKLDAFAPIDDRERVGNVVCFVVASSHRRNGLATHLLDAACRGFTRAGLSYAEAFPSKKAEADAHNYRGPLQMYLDNGFSIERELENHYLVRQTLR